jgi:ABC-type branched-subunit amino acid transport system ATPase component
MLVLENVSTTIAGIQVLRGISCQLTRGSTVGVVGRNGAGKTTLLRLIMGFRAGHAGRVLLDGQDLADAPALRRASLGRRAAVPARRRASLGIGYAPEDRVMFPSFTVEENLRFPCEVIGMPRKSVDERLEETLSIVPELRPMLARSGAALSGGQGKMAALGRAVMAGERLVLLDEPFQGLAPVLALQYSQSLQRLQQARPELCVVITESNRGLLKDMPTEILVLERGELQRGEAAAAAVH